MRPLFNLTIANLRSFIRDRAALFWTLAFPILFISLFGFIFSSSGQDVNYKVAWVDQDGSTASSQLRTVFAAIPALTLVDQPDEATGRDAMKKGDVKGVIVVPKDYSKAVAAAQTGVPNGGVAGAPADLTVYVDPSQQTTSAVILGIVSSVVGRVNLGGQPAMVGVNPVPIQAAGIGAASYFVPSILAMALMQLGLFGAIPLVQQREKLILKRLNATPLRRWTLIGSNVSMRLMVAIVQTILIVAVGSALFGVTVLGSWLVVVGLVVLGALTFISLGYVVASFAPTEESANMITSIIQFPLMFLSGIFFPLEAMPSFLRAIAALLPLTYLGDALRQVMVGGTPFVSVGFSVVVLFGWLVACFVISSRYFKWQ